MYSGGLTDGIWGEAPNAYVPGSILAYWKLCIAAGLQMEYGMRPGCICATVDTCELGAMYSGGLADGILECPSLVLYSKPGSLRIFRPRGRRKTKGFRNGQFHIPSHVLFFSYSICKSVTIGFFNTQFLLGFEALQYPTLCRV